MSGQVPHPREEACQNATRPATVLAKHDIPFFFLLTFAFSWAIYLCLSLIRVDESAVLSRWLLIAGFGPSVAALFLARLTDPRLEAPDPIRRAVLFVLTFVFALGIELLDHRWWSHRMSASLIAADVILVSLAALVVSGVLSRRRGVKDLMRGLVRYRIGAVWYLVALALWPAMVVAANALGLILGLDAPAAPAYPAGIPLIPLIIESFIWVLLFGGPLNEEAGWRAFALARLERRLSPLTAGIIVGAIWGLWHVPLHLMGAYPMGPIGAVIRIFDIPRAILFTWLYNRTRRSLLPVLLLHAAVNTTSLFLARNYVTSSLLMLVLAIGAVFLDKMWRAAPAAGKHPAGPDGSDYIEEGKRIRPHIG